MKKNRIFTSTLIAASFALSVPALAETTYLPDSTSGDSFNLGSGSEIAAGDYAIAEGAEQGWFIPWVTSGGAGSYSLSFGESTTFSGEGLIGIFFNQGSGDGAESVDLTNVTASGLSGQLIVLNNWNNRTDVKLLGDTWASVEYLFANAVDDTTLAEKYGLTGLTRGDLNNDFGTKTLDDYLALQGNTTLAGVTGATKGATTHDPSSNHTITLADHEFITVETAGTVLTIAGSDTYAFYGTVGASGTEVSLEMKSSDGKGKQTFGGTNYLQNVTVTAGTLALEGTTSIAGSVSVASGSTLELGGEITLSSAISNSGTVTIDASTIVFVLDSLASDNTYTVISGDGSITVSGGNLTYSNFTINGETLSSRAVIGDTSGGGLIITYAAGNLIWNGTTGSNTWTTDTSVTNWTNSSTSSPDSFYNGDNVTFGTHSQETSQTVSISETLTAGSIAVNDNYTFVFANGIKVEAGYVDVASGKTLTLQLADGASSAEFHMDSESWYQFFSNAGTRENHGTVEIGAGVTFYLSDSTDTATIGSKNYGAVVTGTGTLSVETTGQIGLYLPNFEGTVEFRSGTVRIGHDNTYGDTGVFNSKATLQFDSGVGITLVGSSSVEVSAKLVFAEGSHTIATGNVTAAEFSGAIDATSATITKSDSGTITFSGTDVNIGTLSVSNGSITFTGTATIGTFNTASNGNAAGNTIALGENAKLTVGTLTNAWGSNFTLAEDSVLTVTGTTSFEPGSTARTVSGSGTFNTEKLSLSNYANYTFSGITLNIGSGGIVSEGNNTGWTNNHLTFGDDLTVGVYGGADGTNTSWSTSATIQFTKSTTGSGTTFSTESGQSITLSGTLTGAGFSNTGSGTLTLSGTVELSSAITNSGNIVINSSTVFVLDNLKSDGHGTYVIIDNVDSGTIDGWTSLDTGNFSFSDGTEITSVTVSTSGQVTISTNAKDLIWNGGSEGTWDTSSSNWVVSETSTSTTFSSGDYVTFTGDTTSTITVVNDGVKAANVTVSSGTYSFAGGDITVREYFTIGTGAEVDLNSGNSTIYGDIVVDGTLKLNTEGGSSGLIHGTITINDGGKVELNDGDVTGWGDGNGVTAITINKGGELYVGTTSNQTLGGCELVLVGGTIDGVSGSNLDLYHSSSKVTVLAESGASAENPTVSYVTNVTLTPRASDSAGGATEFFVDENAKLVVASGIRSGAGGDSTYNCDLEKTGAGTLEVSGFFALNTGSLIIDAGTVILSGTAGYSDLSYGFASAITVAEGASLELAFQSGDATISSLDSKGTLKITGTTLTVTGAASATDLTLTEGSLVFNSGTYYDNITLSKVTVATSATLSVSNYYDHITIGELVGSGTLSLGNSASDTHATIYELGGSNTSSQFSGTITLSDTNTGDYRGVTLVISDAYVAAGAVVEMGAEGNTDGCIALGVNASKVEIAGLSSTNSGGDVVYSGSVSLGATLGNGGATLIDYKNQASGFENVGTSRNTLVINTAEDKIYSFSGVFMDMLNIEKKGAGTQSITFNSSVGESAYYFDGTIAVNAGTLNLSGIATNSAGITVAQDATLNIANDITLTTASDLSSCTSTISGNLGLSGTLTVASDATLAIESTASVTINSAISNSGTITIAEGASIVVGSDLTKGTYTDGNNGDVGYYVLISGSGDDASVTLNGSVTFVIGEESVTLNSLLQRYAGSDTWNIYSEGGYLVIYEATSDEKPANIYWAGSDGNSTIWVADDDSTIDWSGSDGGEAVYSFADGDAVIFGTAAESKTVAVSGTVAPGSITINGEYTFNKDSDADSALVQTSELTFGDSGKLTIGDDVTVQITETLDSFSANGTIVGTGTLQLELSDSNYSATVNLGTQNEFAGTVYITAGNFTLNGSDIGNGTFRLADGVNMQVNSSGTEVGNNFIFEGTSEVHINENDSLTINGSITGVAGDDGAMGGTFDRQGAGSLTITGNVDIGTFIIDTSGNVSVSSSTTFSGESVTIGTLDIAYSDSVVFTNSGVTIGSIVFGEDETGTIEFKNGGTVGEIDYTERLGSGTIIVSSGTLNVGTIVDTFSGEAANAPMVNLQVGTGAVLHAETITIAPGGAGSYYSKISGITDGGAGTVIADKFNVGSAGGASVEISDVTLIVGTLSYGTAGNGSNYNLFLKDATLGFTDNTEIKSTTGTNDTSRFVLGGFASGNSTDTGSNTKTTINTSKYDVETGAFSSEGVTVTISQIISGQGELEVTGVGKLILSAENTYSGGTTIKEGATVVVQNESALGSGKVSVASGATLQLDTAVTVTGTGSTVTFAVGASIVLGGDLLDSILDSADTGTAVAVITANDISFGGYMASNYSSDSDSLSDIVNQYVTSNQYGITWSWSDGTLWAVAAIPEPSTFGVLFGLGALGLVATRRRRRRRAA